MSPTSLKTHIRLFFLIIMLFKNQTKAFSFENAWENVTFVPSLSEYAKKDNEFFEKDSFNELSYTITRPVDISDGSLFLRPTFITEIISPQITSVTRNTLNHTQRRYNSEETPFFYDVDRQKYDEPIKNKNVIGNVSEELKNESVLNLNNETKAISKEEHLNNLENEKKKMALIIKKNKNKEHRKINDLSHEIKELNKQAGFLIKSFKELKDENNVLKKKLKTKEILEKSKFFSHQKKQNRKRISSNKKKAKRRRFYSPHVKTKKIIHNKNDIFKKMERLKRIDLFFKK